jgi:hypothetical protein
MAADTWQMTDPHRPHPDHAVIDHDSLDVLEDAVYQLSIYRAPMSHGDGLLRVHALASLINQADALLANAVADARDQDHPWSDIARQLGISADSARRRYRRHHQTRRPPIDPD